jgi:hypothetical protein
MDTRSEWTERQLALRAIPEDVRRERDWHEPAEAIPDHVKTTRGGLVKK